MQHQQLTPEQKARIKKREERRRRERRQREDEYRRRIERLRRQIEEARKRRQRMLLLFLLAVLAMQESILAAFQRSYVEWPDADPKPSNWTPDPTSDFAPRPGHDDHCDGYSFEEWTKMADERGISLSSKAALKRRWEADPEHENFPARYKNWGYRPTLSELMYELTARYWQHDALKAIKLMSPPDTHRYLDEACVLDIRDVLMCRAGSNEEITKNFRFAAINWEFRKEKEAEEARREKELSRENEGDKGISEPK